jgi:hypothetical protein
MSDGSQETPEHRRSLVQANRNDEEKTETLDEDVSPNEVFWEDGLDPANPQNWSLWKKTINISIISAMTFITPLASSMFAPGVPDLMREFHSNRWV